MEEQDHSFRLYERNYKEFPPFDTAHAIELRHLLRTRNSISRPSTPRDFSVSLGFQIQTSSFSQSFE